MSQTDLRPEKSGHRMYARLREAVEAGRAEHEDNNGASCAGGRFDCCDYCEAASLAERASELVRPDEREA